MLSRRHLRVKLMQSLYSFIQSDENDVAKGEQELMKSIDEVYDLYILLMDLFLELKAAEEALFVERRNKHLPTELDLNPNRKFVENRVFTILENCTSLKHYKSERKISWADNDDLPRRLKNIIKKTSFYDEYMNNPESSLESDKKFIIKAFKRCIADNELLGDYLEEVNIHWSDDLFFVCSFVVKTIKKMEEGDEDAFELLPLYKDPQDDRAFIQSIFRRTILNNQELEQIIQKKAKNWELDRIATMDMLLMKMAITELKEVTSVPVKVTLNEFIELAKSYSTPKSKVFINGILDKLVLEFTDEGLIQKSGRGLKEE